MKLREIEVKLNEACAALANKRNAEEIDNEQYVEELESLHAQATQEREEADDAPKKEHRRRQR